MALNHRDVRDSPQRPVLRYARRRMDRHADPSPIPPETRRTPALTSGHRALRRVLRPGSLNGTDSAMDRLRAKGFGFARAFRLLRRKQRPVESGFDQTLRPGGKIRLRRRAQLRIASGVLFEGVIAPFTVSFPKDNKLEDAFAGRNALKRPGRPYR